MSTKTIQLDRKVVAKVDMLRKRYRNPHDKKLASYSYVIGMVVGLFIDEIEEEEDQRRHTDKLVREMEAKEKAQTAGE